jgi:hypothetical protein
MERLDFLRNDPQRILDRACARCPESKEMYGRLGWVRSVSGGEPVDALQPGSTLRKDVPSSVACNNLLRVGIIFILPTLQSFHEASDKVSITAF